MQSFRQMVDAVVKEGGVDTTTGGVTAETVKDRLNDRYVDMVTRAKWRKAEVELGVAVAGQAEYPVQDPNIRELEQVRIGSGVRYTRVGQDDLWDLRSNQRGLTGRGGVFAPDYTAAGVDQVELFPAPDAGGDTIFGLAVLGPVLLREDTDVPKVPEEFVPYIVHGALAWLLATVDERQDEAAYFEQQYESGVELLRRRRNMRFGGGPVQFQVKGYHFA